MARTVVNKDGSITTSSEDEVSPAAETKVVAPEEDKPAPKSRSRAESK